MPGNDAIHAAIQPLAQRHRLRWMELLPWALAIAAYFVASDFLALGTQILIAILFTLSLDLIIGYAGIITLGHAAFYGVGAYAAGMLAAKAGWSEPFSGLLFAGLAAGVVGLVSGLILLRYTGLALLMLTMATAILLYEIANVQAEFTGGFDGLLGITIAPLFGRFEYDLWGHTHYLYTLGILFICFVVVRLVVYSPFGLALSGIRENNLRMNAIGAAVRAKLVTVYVISAVIAGIAGGLFAQTNAFVTLEVLGFHTSGAVMVMLVLGGMGRLYGAFAGATVYILLRSELAKISPEFWEIGVGVTLIFVVMYARGGLLEILSRVATRLGGRKA